MEQEILYVFIDIREIIISKKVQFVWKDAKRMNIEKWKLSNIEQLQIVRWRVMISWKWYGVVIISDIMFLTS